MCPFARVPVDSSCARVPVDRPRARVPVCPEGREETYLLLEGEKKEERKMDKSYIYLDVTHTNKTPTQHIQETFLYTTYSVHNIQYATHARHMHNIYTDIYFYTCINIDTCAFALI